MLYKLQSKKYLRKISLLAVIGLLIGQSSCKKYLDQKPSQNLAVPSSLRDLQAILDNQTTNNSTPAGFLEFVADNYYLKGTSWSPLVEDLRNNYVWNQEARITASNAVWTSPYQAIYNSNFVLDFLPKIIFNESEQDIYNSIRGSALFYRAFLFHQLAQLFCKPYSSSSTVDLGIVLRLSSAVEPTSTRATVQRTYDQIINDLKIAADILPLTTLFATRPNKAAAYGMLARVYLSMNDWVNAEQYANSAIDISSGLLNFNLLSPVSDPLLPTNYISNPEVLFLSRDGGNFTQIFGPSHVAIVDSILYKSYDANGLRKSVFFGLNTNANSNYWKGSYYSVASNYSIFDGIALDEIYLIKAESEARNGDIVNAMVDLNTLLHNRWRSNQFTDLGANSIADAINKILTERRKELVFRGLRWSDLRRLNQKGADITLTRNFDGVSSYTLPANNLRWVLQIPDLEINRSGIQQNPR